MPIRLMSLFFCMMLSSTLHAVSILLDPAGDMRTTGRLIGDTYERTCMQQLAQGLKAELEKKGHTVLLSRLPGEQVTQKEKAQLANQCTVDIVLRLQAYHCANVTPQLHIFYYDTQQMHATRTTPHVLSYQKAHTLHHKESKGYAQAFYAQLQQEQYTHFLYAHEPIGMPCVALKGVVPPAICIECGMQRPSDWHYLTQPLTEVVDICLNDLSI